MRALRLALWPTGLAFGGAAEVIGQPELPALDALTGLP
jgi:hypothetical protein